MRYFSRFNLLPFLMLICLGIRVFALPNLYMSTADAFAPSAAASSAASDVQNHDANAAQQVPWQAGGYTKADLEQMGRNAASVLQLQSRLEESLTSYEKVVKCSVTLDVREQGSKAFLVVTPAPNETITAENQEAMKRLVCASCPDLTEDNVWLLLTGSETDV